MPIVDYSDLIDKPYSGGAERIDLGDGSVAATMADGPSMSETFGAAFRLDNTIGSVMSSETVGISPYERDEGFSPFEEIKGTKYEQYPDQAANIFNRKYFEAWKTQIDREEEDRRTIEAAGWGGTGASAVAAILDLPSLIPGGAVVRGATKASNIARMAGTTAIAGGVGAAASEASLQATQKTRTGLETGVAIGSGVIFGGLLGGAVGALLRPVEKAAATRAIDGVRAKLDADESLTPEADAVEEYMRINGGSSAGAAEVAGDTLEDLSIAGKAASAVGKSLARMNPNLRALHSPSVKAREILLGMMENSVYLKKNMSGRGEIAAETAQKQWERGAYGIALETNLTEWKAARKAGLIMTREEFGRAVGQAMRNNDAGENEFVTRAAKAWRESLVEPLKREAQATGQLPKELQDRFGETYLHRVYRSDKIKAQENLFKDAVREHVMASVDRGIGADLSRASKQTDNLQRQVDELEIGILRRRSEFEQREQGGEIELADGATESDVISMIRTMREQGRPKPPETLTSFLRRRGLYDPGGDLNAIGINNRTSPGFVRKTRSINGEKGGGLGLDDAAYLAWEEGFFPEWAERPSIRDFMTALEDDFRKLRRVVREADTDAARAMERFDEIEATLARMGVDIKNPKFATSEEMRSFAKTVNTALEDLDRQKIGTLKAKLDEARAQREQLADPFVSDDDKQDYIEGILSDIVNKVTGLHQDDIPYGMVSVQQGPLKERTLHVPDKVLAPWLEDDVEMVNRRYARRMGADVELARKYGRADMRDQIKEITADYDELKRGVTDEKTLSFLNNRMKRDIKDVKDARDLLRGNFAAEANASDWARVARAAQTFNYLRSMGGVLLASLTDAVRPAMVHGLTAYMRDGILPLARNLDAVKLSAKDAKLAGAISERILQSRLATMAELTDPYSHNSPFERLLDNAANKFSTLTGLNHWNDFQKTLTSVMTQNRILQNAGTDYAKLKSAEKAYMGYLGIDEDMGRRIASQFSEHGETIDGVRVANTEEWSDAVARRTYYAAINKDVDSIIVTKGVGDVPTFANHPLGRAVIQFKSFALASNQRVLMRGLQESPARMIGGVMGMTTIGMFIYWLKAQESGREVSNNPGNWVAEGLDRSGIFSVAFEINNLAEKWNAPGVYAALSGTARAINPAYDKKKPASRFAIRGTAESLAGPTAGLINDIATVASTGVGAAQNPFKSGANQTEITKGDIKAARRLTPFASLPYWRWIIDGGFGLQDGNTFRGVVPEAERALAN
jgi:hypothetical protein